MQTPEYYTTQEVAKMCRMSARSFLERGRFRPGVPDPVKPFGRLLWPKQKFDAFIESTKETSQ